MSGKRGGGSKAALISLLLPLLVVLSGCCSGRQPTSLVRHAIEKEKPFEELWSIYTSCRSNRDPEGAWRDARRLEELTRTSHTVAGGPVLPPPLNRLVSPPPVRLSVDPRAMAAACLLHAAELAQPVGWATAAAMFMTLIRHFPEADYAYYVAQARSGSR